MDLAALDRTLTTLATRLLERRASSGHWEGRLASSALSTALATVALALDERVTDREHHALIRRGLSWLIANQNDDGGWGDTVLSFSNLSTTALCWAALSEGVGSAVPRQEGQQGLRTPLQGAAIERAERWLRAHVGDLSAASLQDAIVKRYGKDRTFSAPILTVLALTGRLGSGAKAWRLVPQLPFEMAACPHRWFRWLRLPVVSYALPALVAIGQARHYHAPTRNPLLGTLRSTLRARTLQVARDMQPDSGGYLEATPLTAFIVMSLIGSGNATDAIVTRGIRFLIDSARVDGSWPIDTNLATWVTTLSVEALGGDGRLCAEDRQRILTWLLPQQGRQEHPFTRARPGGWAWTNLSGGVPDADDTASALIALWNLDGAKQLDAAVAGINWMLDLQNGDGGIPTFCRGWGALPFDRSAPDLTAHALEAWSTWYPVMPRDLQRRISRATERAVSYLARHQRADGSWAPLWFGNQHAAGEVNLTYGTARVVAALTVPLVCESAMAERLRSHGLTWLLNAQNTAGGWGGGVGCPSSIEETAMAVQALAVIPRPADKLRVDVSGVERRPARDVQSDLKHAMTSGVRWLVAATDEGQCTPASPIGLYFARLWYYEELYPVVFSLSGLSQARRALRPTHLAETSSQNS